MESTVIYLYGQYIQNYENVEAYSAIIPALILLLLYFYYYKMALTIATSASNEPQQDKLMVNSHVYQVYKIHRENRHYRCLNHRLKHDRCKSTLIKTGSTISSVTAHSSHCQAFVKGDKFKNMTTALALDQRQTTTLTCLNRFIYQCIASADNVSVNNSNWDLKNVISSEQNQQQSGTMFKKLKSQVQEAVTDRLNTITGSPSQPSSVAGDNPGLSRTNSFSSIASADSTIPNLFGNYTTPPRKYYPPSDVSESELDDSFFTDLPVSPAQTNESKKLNKLLDIYKNKFTQLKEAYAESEAEKEKIKKVLAESQDKVLRRVHDLKEQAEIDKKLRKDQEFQLKLQMQDKDEKISVLKSQLAAKDIINQAQAQQKQEEKLVDLSANESVNEDDHQQLKDKCAKLETLLTRCKELIKTQKATLAEKEKTVSDQTELLEKKAMLETDLEAYKKKTVDLESRLKDMQDDYEMRLSASNDLNASLSASVERTQKRCNDLNMELDEKGNLFQQQFQVFQKEFLDREEGLKNKLKLLQDDYFNAEQELAAEKEKSKVEAVEEAQLVKSKAEVVELDVSKLEAEKKALQELEECNRKLKEDLEALENQLKEKSTNLTVKSEELQSLSLKLDSQAQEYESNLNELKTSSQVEIDALKQTNEKLASQLEAVTKECSQLNANIESSEASIKADSELKSSMAIKIDTLTKELELKSVKLNEANVQLESLQVQVSSQESSDSKLKNLNQNLMQSLKESREKLAESATEIKSLTDQIEQGQVKQAELVGNHEKELEAINSTNQQAVVALDEQLKVLESERNELEERVMRQQSELEDRSGLDGLVEKSEAEKAVLNGTIQKLEEEKEQLERALKEQVGQTTTEIVSLNDMVKGLETVKAQMESGLKEQLEKNQKEYEERLEQLEVKRKELETELVSKKKFMEKMLEKHTSTINEKTAQATQEIENLKTEKSEVSQKLADAVADSQKAQEAREEVERSLKKEIEDSSKRLKKLENKNVKLEKQLNEKTEDLGADLMAQKKEMDQVMKSHEQEVEQLKQSIESHVEEKERLERERAKLVDEIALSERQFAEKLEASETKLVSVENNVKDLQAAKEALLAEVKTQKDEVQRLNVELENSTNSANDVENNLKTLEAKLRDLEAEKEGLLVEAKAHKDEIQRLNVELENSTSVAKNVADLEAKLKDLVTEKEGLLVEAKAQKDEIQRLNVELENRANKVNSLENSMKDLEAEKEAFLNEAKTQKDEIQRLNVELENSTSVAKNVTDLEAQKQAIQSENNRLLSDVQKLRESIVDIESDKSEYQRQVEQLQQDLTNQTSKLDQLKEQSGEKDLLSAQVQKLTDDLASQRGDFDKELETLKGEIQKESVAKQEAVERFDAKTVEANQMLEDLQREKTDLAQKLSNAMADSEQAQTEMVKSLEAEIGLLKTKESEAESVNTALKQEIEQLKKDSELQSQALEELKKSHKVELEGYKPKLEKLDECLMEVLNLNVKVQSLNDEKASLEAEMSQKEEALKARLGEIKGLEESVLSMKGDLSKELDLSRSQMEEVCRKNEDEVSNLRKTIEELNETLTQLVAEKQNLQLESQEKLEQVRNKLTNQLNTERLANKEETELTNKRQAETHAEAIRVLEERLKNTQIDLNASNEKLTDSLKDYKNSIAKFKNASTQRYQRLKKKFASSVGALNQINTELLDEGDDNLLSSLLVYLNTTEKKKNDAEVSPGPETTAEDQSEYEFDEAKFKEFFKTKRSQLEQNPSLLADRERGEKELLEVGVELEKAQVQAREAADKLAKLELKFKDEKERMASENQRNLDDLQLKLANLDLKNKQMTLEENKESYAIKRKLAALEEELGKEQKEKEKLTNSRQADELKFQKSIAEAKQKADLRVAAIKKQFENDQSAKSDDMTNQNMELQVKIKEQAKQIVALKVECENYASRIGAVEIEMERQVEQSGVSGKEAVELKVKHYEEFIAELDRKHAQKLETNRVQIENLRAELERVEKRAQEEVLEAKAAVGGGNLSAGVDGYKAENRELTEQLEKLKNSYDDLLDEKNQLYMSLKELKIKQEAAGSNDLVKELNASIAAKDRIINSYETRLAAKSENFSSFLERKESNPSTSSDISLTYVNNFKQMSSPSTHNGNRSIMTELNDDETSRLNNSSYHSVSSSMEQTEIDYLKSIVYSYMMGTDPLTMAKVIVAVLKFSDDEKRKLIENEKNKYSWIPSMPSLK